MLSTVKHILTVGIGILGFSSMANAQFVPSMVYNPLARTYLPTYPIYGFAGAYTWTGPAGGVYTAGVYRYAPLGSYREYSPYYGGTSSSSSNGLRRAQREAGSSAPSTSSPTTRPVEQSAVLLADFRSISAPVTDVAIQDGSALNETLSAHIAMERTGQRQAPGYLAPELTQSIRFGGIAGDLANWVRAGEIEYPTTLLRPEYEIPRKWLKHDFKIVADQIIEGKQPESGFVTGLTTALKSMRRTFDDRKTSYTANEVKETEAFLNRFEVMIGQTRNTSLRGIIDSDWSKYGVSVANLVDHMQKHKLTFAPCRSEATEQYRELHGALSASAKTVAELFK